VARSGISGEIGCMVQNGNKWVITGFADVLPGSTIVIKGLINLPSTTGSIGAGEIITYSDNNLTDIHTNGSKIDSSQLIDFNLVVVDTFAMNANEDVFMTQRSVIREGYIGEYRELLSTDQQIKKNDTITLRMNVNDIKGTTGGFILSSRPIICEFVRI
jgi:hypothetical protein